MKTNIVKGFQVLFALCLVYFAIRLLYYHYGLITFPYPIMYREGAMMATTTMLLHGVNPYLYLLEPQYTNIYGILYPLIVLPFVSLFGNTLVVYRAVTAFFILASCSVIFLVLYKKKAPLLLNFWAVLTLYASLLYPLTSTPSVDPASMGLFLMLLVIFIPFFFNYSYLSFFLSILCGLLAFYAKPYFLLGVPVIASYLFFFVSKRRSIFFGWCCLASFTLSVVIMNYFFPSYFDDCFFVHYNYLTHNCMILVLNRQLYQFLNLNQGIFFLMLVVTAYVLWQWFMQARVKNAQRVLKKPLISIQWKDSDAPLISKGLPLEIYAGICFAIVLVLIMGRKLGANLWYFFQLFSPFLVTFVACFTGRFTLWPVAFSALLIYNLFSLTSDDDHKYFSNNAIGVIGWQEMEKLVRSKDYIFNSSLIAPLMIKEDKEVFDDGHTVYYYNGMRREGLLGHFFPADDWVGITESLLIARTMDMMKYKKFDLIIIEEGYHTGLAAQEITKYYKYGYSILLNAPQDRKFYVMNVWSPN